MCLILVGWKTHRDCSLVVAANRDEFHARPAATAAFWPDHPQILAGRDLQARGTWLGIARNGRFASVTNYRGGHDPSAAESRGALVARFLLNGLSPGKTIAEIKPDSYSGFNLLLADQNELWWLSNRDGDSRRLEPGWYGLGNLLLDTPDVAEHKQRFRDCPVAVEPLFGVLAKAKIVNERYGTRCSSVLIVGEGIGFAERAFGSDGSDEATLRYEFSTRRIS